jgi:Kef-type K+ transport system membrane component KefB
VDQTEVFASLAWIVGAAAIAPLVVGLLPRPRLPEVVLLLALGMALGPFGLGLAEAGPEISILSQLGLALLFLFAGIEVDPAELRSRDGARALNAWLLSLGIALAWTYFLSVTLGVVAWQAVAIAMTSTALGTLLPLLRDTGLQNQPIGRLVLANGAVGEFGPIIAMSLLLSQGSAWGALVSLLTFGVFAAVLAFLLVRHTPRAQRVTRVVRRGADTTAQSPIRLVLLLLTLMLADAAGLGLDVVLGAFVAGAIVRMLLPDEHSMFMARLDGIGYGFLIPVFFVVSGMGIDPDVLIDEWLATLVVFLSILVIRGAPVMFLFRHLARRHLVQLGLFSATGLPIIVAVTTVAVEAGQMKPEGQSIVVAAGMLTVLVLPMTAFSLHREPTAESSAHSSVGPAGRLVGDGAGEGGPVEMEAGPGESADRDRQPE